MLKLRQIELHTPQGKGVALACKEAETAEERDRDACLRQEIFDALEAQTVIGLWQSTCDRLRPHSSLGYRPPAPVTCPDRAFRRPMAAAIQ